MKRNTSGRYYKPKQKGVCVCVWAHARFTSNKQQSQKLK